MAVSDITILDYSDTEIQITITDDGGSVEYNIIKRHDYSTDIDPGNADNVIIRWRRGESERDVKTRVLDYNLVSNPVTASGAALQKKINAIALKLFDSDSELSIDVSNRILYDALGNNIASWSGDAFQIKGVTIAPTKIYFATISQTGTSDPSIDALTLNTLSGTPTLTRGVQGKYYLTLTGEFLANKVYPATELGGAANYYPMTILYDFAGINIIGYVQITRYDDDNILIETFDAGVNLSDDILLAFQLKLEVYA